MKPRQSCLQDAHADVRRTRTTSTTPSCASPLPLHCRNHPPHQSCSRYAVIRRLGFGSPPPTDGHRTTLNNFAMGSSKAPSSSTTSRFQRTTRRSLENKRRTHHCQQKEVLLFPYSCKSYVSAHTVFIPRKKLVERFLLHLLRDTKCTRFPSFTILPFLEVSSPPGFQFRVSRTAIKRSSTLLGVRST